MTDLIADMLMRIRNAAHGRHQRVDVPSSHFKAEIAASWSVKVSISRFFKPCTETADGTARGR